MAKEVSIVNDSLDGLLRKDGITVIRFTAPWCGPCRMLAPVMGEVAEKRDDVNFIKVDCDENSDTPTRYGVRSIPYIVFVNDAGKVVKDHIGACSEKQINELIDDAIATHS